MTERLRIQKQMSHIEEDFPHLAKYLSGWPASTHGTQVLGLAEMKAKEILTGNAGNAVYAVAPGVGETGGTEQSDLTKVDRTPRKQAESKSAESAKDSGHASKDEGASIGRRQINLRGLPIDE